MEDPRAELPGIIKALTEGNDKAKHELTVDTYFTEDAGFSHPMVDVKGGDGSREQVKRVYAVYKVFTSNVDVNIDSVSFDSHTNRAVIELTESMRFPVLLWMPVRDVKIIVVLDLYRNPSTRRFYIKHQYDAFPVDSVAGVLPFPFSFGYRVYRKTATITGALVGYGLKTWGFW